jgi:hypothetical protein
MTERRDFGLMAGEMREALEQYSREELADLLTHVVRVFVVEGQSPVQVDHEDAPAGLDELKGLTFAQLVLHLQMNLPHPELQRLRVSGPDVWAEADGAELRMTGSGVDGPAEEPPDADIIGAHDSPGVFTQSAPTRRPFPSAPEPAPEPEPPSPWDLPPPASRQEAASIQRPDVSLRDPAPQAPPPRLPDPEPDEDIGDASDRFSMLELD